MSEFKITKPGFYRQRNGGKAEVFAECGQWWYGVDTDGYARRWSNRGLLNPHVNCDYAFDLVAPWTDAPDPGEGWRLLEEGEQVTSGDEYWHAKKEWKPVCQFPKFDSNIYVPHRRRVRPPFRISDKGPGLYATRDGRTAKVTEKCTTLRPWHGTVANYTGRFCWHDDGTYQGVPGQQISSDLVRYIGPLPDETPWVATSEYRQHARNHEGVGSFLYWEAAYEPHPVRIERKWTRGLEVEWRPVGVEP